MCSTGLIYVCVALAFLLGAAAAAFLVPNLRDNPNDPIAADVQDAATVEASTFFDVNVDVSSTVCPGNWEADLRSGAFGSSAYVEFDNLKFNVNCSSAPGIAAAVSASVSVPLSRVVIRHETEVASRELQPRKATSSLRNTRAL